MCPPGYHHNGIMAARKYSAFQVYSFVSIALAVLYTTQSQGFPNTKFHDCLYNV